MMLVVFRSLMLFMMLLTKSFSSLLSFLIDWMMMSIFSLLMPTVMRRGIWSEGLHILGRRKWLP